MVFVFFVAKKIEKEILMKARMIFCAVAALAAASLVAATGGTPVGILKIILGLEI